MPESLVKLAAIFYLLQCSVHEEGKQHLVKPVTMEEVKSAIFEQGNGKSPGPDGYTPHFFESARSVVWEDVFAAVQCFF